MPYQGERAHRLGHVDMARAEHISKKMEGWQISHSRPSTPSQVTSLCRPVDTLAGGGLSDGVKFALSVDGSDTEVEATREYPSVKVGYLRIAGSFVDLEKVAESGQQGPFVDPSMLRSSHRSSSFQAVLPGSGLAAPGLTGERTWRNEVTDFLVGTAIDAGSSTSLADALLSIHGQPGSPATTLPVRRCPECEERLDPPAQIPLTGGSCPRCTGDLLVADVIRSSDEYTEIGSNLSPLTRLMLLSERLVVIGFLETIYRAPNMSALDLFARTIYVSDGPLALMGTSAPLKRRIQEYHAGLFQWTTGQSTPGPFIVGIEKTGAFAEHAEQIRDLIPEGHVMALTNSYINRITGRPQSNHYGTDEFYGRRFLYRTSTGNVLVITVPPRVGVAPYEGAGCEDIASYPTLRPICEVLDRVETRLYPNSVIPIALAHSSASLPLGVGTSVLTAMAQASLKLKQTHQIKHQPKFK